MIKIAVDAMGGDFAPKEQIEGVYLALDRFDDIEITLFGEKKLMQPFLKADHPRLTFVETEGVIAMGEKDPIGAIRSNRKSSMAMALKSVKDASHDAVVSSGATQALIAGAHMIIGRMKGIKRTAIAPVLPTVVKDKPFILLDAGGNVEIKPEFMVQQAYFATVYAKEILGDAKPQVGLLNIGAEEGKGRLLDHEAAAALKAHPAIDFYGNVEPKDILNPPTTILLSDGFTANIVMKTIEGSARGFGIMLKEELAQGIFGKLGLLLSIKNLKSFKKRLSPEEIGGAMIYGLDGVLVKAQGSSKANGFYNGIRQARKIVHQDVLGKVRKILEASSDDSA